MQDTTEAREIRKAPRADTLSMDSGDDVHDRWSLHAFAFEQESDWLPTRLRRYHKDRFINEELMEGYYDEFIPETYDTPRGSILKKKIEEKTTFCPDCDVAARRYDGDTMCPKCGLLCSDSKSSDNLVRDPKAAGRMPEDK
jgi:hypothetical protein